MSQKTREEIAKRPWEPIEPFKVAENDQGNPAVAIRPQQPRGPPERVFVRLPDVMKATGLARSTIYWMVSRNEFPRPVRLGGRAVGWIEDEVRAWQQSRIALRDTEAA